MKCPMMREWRQTLDAIFYYEHIDCLKEDCAVWLEDIQMCPIKAYALELRYLQQRLADLVYKMPSLE